MVNLQIDHNLRPTAQSVKDKRGNISQLSLSTEAVGIGTVDPTKALHIVGAAPIDANDGQLQIAEPSGNFMLVGRAADYAFVQSHNREPLALNPLGNAVGVGTTNATSQLHIVSATPADANDGQLKIAEPNGNFMLVGRAGDYAFVQSHNREPLALNPIGNKVGIGTTNPTELLEVNGSIRVADDVILTRADCAEEFDVEPASDVEPGTVMVIGTKQCLRHCSQRYDRRVAGIVSGTGDRRPGIVLGRCHSTTDQARISLALVGTVLCNVDATTTSIEVGDLLTTSSTPGHAMRATDPMRSFGAVVGKALEGLASGTGMIPVLVTLQ